jgi:hypothetical protein
MRHRLIVGWIVAAAALAACTEKPQTASARKSDSKAWEGAAGGFVAPGWKVGDEASWEAQMRHRAQSQNEYARAAAQPN